MGKSIFSLLTSSQVGWACISDLTTGNISEAPPGHALSNWFIENQSIKWPKSKIFAACWRTLLSGDHVPESVPFYECMEIYRGGKNALFIYSRGQPDGNHELPKSVLLAVRRGSTSNDQRPLTPFS